MSDLLLKVNMWCPFFFLYETIFLSLVSRGNVVAVSSAHLSTFGATSSFVAHLSAVLDGVQCAHVDCRAVVVPEWAVSDVDTARHRWLIWCCFFPAALFNSIPFIGFGFLDNVIMITAVSTVFSVFFFCRCYCLDSRDVFLFVADRVAECYY